MPDFKLQISPSLTPKIKVSGFVDHSDFGIPGARVVGVTGVEPVTLRLSSACSNQLSYTPESIFRFRIAGFGLATTDFVNPQSAIANPQFRLVELRRFELPTYSLQSYRSTN